MPPGTVPAAAPTDRQGVQRQRDRRRLAKRKRLARAQLLAQENRHFLDKPAGARYGFSELSRKSGSCVSWGPADHGFGGGGSRRSRFARNEKGGQAVENKQSREMTDFVPLNNQILSTPVAKPLVSLCERILSLSVFFRRVEAQKAMARNRRRLRGSRGAARRSAAEDDGRSEMAPQTIGIARNGLGNGAAGSSKNGRGANFIRAANGESASAAASASGRRRGRRNGA